MDDLILDVCFFILAIAGTVFVLTKRKHFDLWLSLPTCAAWVLKGARYLYYDWILAALGNMKAENIYLFMQKAHVALAGMDVLVNLFLFAALVRLVILGLYSYWYRKTLKILNMK